MKISDVLPRKFRHPGSDVVTVLPNMTVRELLSVLAEQGIGAVVVVEQGGGDPEGTVAVEGIVSERDIVRRLDESGAGVLDAPVSQIMTTAVVTCGPEDELDAVAATMTERRIRHMPVVESGRLVGLVSIGDVVFSRMHQLEVDRGQLEQYITG
jgi:CBS domain-containing protein